MRLFGKIVKNSVILREEHSEADDSMDYRESLEKCFLDLCKKLGLEVPLWMKKNTREFALYNKTIFFKGHFIDDVPFDYFEIKVEK